MLNTSPTETTFVALHIQKNESQTETLNDKRDYFNITFVGFHYEMF